MKPENGTKSSEILALGGDRPGGALRVGRQNEDAKE